jgi:hypothetical protein
LNLQEILAQIDGMSPEALAELKRGIYEERKKTPWIPTPGPQARAEASEADELFYGGQAGGGKTALLLGQAVTKHKHSLILRRTNKEAEKLPQQLEEIIGNDHGLNRSTMTWKLGDRVIDMGGCQLEQDKQKRKGIAHDLKGFDEIADFSETQYRFIIAWNRSTDPNQRCRVICTGNPPTTAEGFWVIKHWAAWLDPTYPNPAKDGELRWFTLDTDTNKDIEVDGPGPHLINGEEIMARSRTFIRAKLEDNPYLAQTDYDSVLAALPELERLAYREGQFDMSMRDAQNQAIPTEWIREAQARWTEKPKDGIPMCAMGVDMTGGGRDPMIIVQRYDSWFSKFIEIPAKEFDMESLGRQAAAHIIANRRDDALVTIDLGGGYGQSTFEQLKDNRIQVYGYKGSEGANMRAKTINIPFQNTRSAAIWRLREALDPTQPGKSQIALPDDPEMVADLTGPTYKIENHTIKVESKEKVCERLGRSTDKGDAIIMAWFKGKRFATDALEMIDREQGFKRRGMKPRVRMSRQPRTGRRR